MDLLEKPFDDEHLLTVVAAAVALGSSAGP
jgi:FixJ family two-component response regulator